MKVDAVRTSSWRFGLIPLLTIVLTAVLFLSTRAEQQRQVDAMRRLFDAHARFVGYLVQEAAQEAAWSTGLVYAMSAEGAGRILDVLGRPGLHEPCASVQERFPEVRVWLGRNAQGTFGCPGPLGAQDHAAVANALLGSSDWAFIDDDRTRRLGVFCTAKSSRDADVLLCLDRTNLDALRQEVGLGPLLAGLHDGDLDYVVVQDEGGILAASPNPGPVSTFADDPVLARIVNGQSDALEGRILVHDNRSTYEALAPLRLADGSQAIVRTALDAGELDRLQIQVLHRQTVMASVLGFAVLLSGLLAWVLARAFRRRAEFADENRRRDEEKRHWQSLGEMAATVAHEVRNPLNTIGMALQRLNREIRVHEQDQAGFCELLDLSVEASDRVRRVVDDFLELGRPLVLNLQPCEADDLLSEALAGLQMRAEGEGKQLTVHKSCTATVRVDRQRLAQVLQNLTGNALDAVAPGGLVTIEFSCDAEYLRIAVSDNGCGMDEETLDHVMAPFFTTKSNGTGLGLPLARRLVQAHHGNLAIESRVGEGTRVVVTLLRNPPEGST